MAEALAEPEPGPAAHSMDSHWFGVDELGHVALFDTQSRGAVAIGHSYGFHYPTFADVLVQWSPELRERFPALPRDPVSGELSIWELPDPAVLGLFAFIHPTDWGAEIEYSDLYERMPAGVPARPVQIAELPVQLRALIEPLRLVGVDFRALERIQPAEFLACATWEGFMGSDGVLQPRPPVR